VSHNGQTSLARQALRPHARDDEPAGSCRRGNFGPEVAQSGASVCQAVGRLGCAAGPGSDFSEVLVVEVGLAALDCRVALMCPPGPANASLVVVTSRA